MSMILPFNWYVKFISEIQELRAELVRLVGEEETAKRMEKAVHLAKTSTASVQEALQLEINEAAGRVPLWGAFDVRGRGKR